MHDEYAVCRLCLPLLHHTCLCQAELLLRGIADVKSAFKLSPEWCQRLERAGNMKKVIFVYKTFAGSHPSAVLKQGDILLAVDGTTIVSLSELEKHCMFRKQVGLFALVFMSEMGEAVRVYARVCPRQCACLYGCVRVSVSANGCVSFACANARLCQRFDFWVVPRH